MTDNANCTIPGTADLFRVTDVHLHRPCRDFESSQHVSECHAASAVPGYVDYRLSHGATLMVDIEDGRFVFFYVPVDL